VVVLARVGLVTVDQLKAFRPYFIVLAAVIAAIVTPPDIVSMAALGIPMCLLYEIGIWATQLFIRKTADPRETPETGTEITKE